jgi:uncharacterized protein (TIGR02300 family)
MATKADRGTKRSCQNSSCSARFYDLNRDPIVCPICGTAYHIPVSPLVADDAAGQRRASKKPEFVAPVPLGEAAESEVEADDALVDVEAGDETIEAADDETFLEEEEEGGDVSGILGGAAPEGEEET